MREEVSLHRQCVEWLTPLQHLLADPGGSLSAVAAGRDDARVACITLHAMRTAARAAASSQQPTRVPYAAPAPLDASVGIALGRLSCRGARALDGEIQRAALHMTSVAAGRTAGERQLAPRPIHSHPTTGLDVEMRVVHTFTSHLRCKTSCRRTPSVRP